MHLSSSHPLATEDSICMQVPVLGFALIFLAAVAGGALAVPLKSRRIFELENIYIPSTLVMMLILPLLMASFVLPHWAAAVRASGTATVCSGAAYGFGWGIGAILFGYGVTLAGMSVGFAIIMGINTAVGSILPLVVGSRSEIFRPEGIVILFGIAGCILGVAICGKAGAIREFQAAGTGQARRFGLAVIVCAASGVLSSCANLGFSFTGRVGREALRLGASPVFSTLASWMPVFWGATVSLLLWFGTLQLRRGTWRRNVGPGAAHDWWMGILMGAIWFLATIPYGMGAYYLGRMGTSVGWALNIACSLIVANVLGFITREWKQAPPHALPVLYSGLGVLIVSIVLLAVGSSMTAP